MRAPEPPVPTGGTTRRALLLLAVSSALVAPSAAHAAVDPLGRLCGYDTGEPPIYGLGIPRRPRLLSAGPLTLLDGDGTARTGTVTCSLQVEPRHADADLLAVTSDPGTGAVVLAPRTVAPSRYPLFVCTEVRVDGAGTRYYDDVTGAWSADPAVPCAEVFYDDTHVDMDPVDCPLLKLVFPPDGDIDGVWDCPPYGS
jgi:hypothetical protein